MFFEHIIENLLVNFLQKFNDYKHTFIAVSYKCKYSGEYLHL